MVVIDKQHVLFVSLLVEHGLIAEACCLLKEALELLQIQERAFVSEKFRDLSLNTHTNTHS